MAAGLPGALSTNVTPLPLTEMDCPLVLDAEMVKEAVPGGEACQAGQAGTPGSWCRRFFSIP